MPSRLFRLGEYSALILMFVIAAVALTVFLALVLPRENPYEPIAVIVNEDTYCATDDATVDVEYVVNDRDAIRSIDIESEWTAVDVPGVNAGNIRFAAESSLRPGELPTGEYVGPGNVVRQTPDTPGVWNLATHYTVRSTRLFAAPVRTTIEAPENTEILALNDPVCQEKRRPS